MKRKSLGLLLLGLLLGMGAPALEAEAAEHYSAEVIYVNPLYQEAVSAEELRVTAPVYFSNEEAEYCETVADAAAVLREQMEDREITITVGVMYDEWTSDVVHEVFQEALTHTGVPTQGDYLAFVYGGWSAVIEGYSDNSTYYITIVYTMKYYTTAEQEAEMDAAVTALLTELKLSDSDDYSKVRGIYDYMCDNIVYDYTNLTDSDYKLKYTAYAALVNKTAVCQGYAVLFYRLALELAVDARIISGVARGAHAWNIVELGGLYYNLDVTWDAGRAEYDYFLKIPNEFSAHVREEKYETEEFHAAYPMSATEYGNQPTEKELITDFVTRMYSIILEREPDVGSETWVDGLADGSFTGVRVADGFILSEEFMNRDMTREEFVKILYRAFFGREADADGLTTWTTLLNDGCKRAYVFAGFANSTEFGTLCSAAGITQGRAAEYLADRQTGLSEQDYKVWCFVERMYTEVLGRTADESGIRTWVSVLKDGSYTGIGVADGFFTSDEFLSKSMTNEEYVQLLYRAFFNRDADTEGLATWTNALNTGDTKQFVFAGFANSDEFGALCGDAGIIQGALAE